jgi:coenzyme Q-binding protein COQ10
MAKAEYTQVVNVPLEKFFDTIVDYDSYPKFVDGCKKVEVKREEGRCVVKYSVSMMKDLWYTLEQNEDRANGKMNWKLIESDTLKSNAGQWTLKSVDSGKKTEVTYAIDIEFAIPVPSFILSKLVKSSLPSMIRGFEKFALTRK